MPPLNLEQGHDGIFLENEFAIEDGEISYWIKLLMRTESAKCGDTNISTATRHTHKTGVLSSHMCPWHFLKFGLFKTNQT